MLEPIADLGLILNECGSGLVGPLALKLDSRVGEAQASVSEFDGKVIGIGITDMGNGYTSIPSLSIDGGGGSLAEAEASIAGNIESIPISGIVPGSGYKAKPNIVFSGRGLKAEAVCEISGCIQSVDIADPGTNYNEPPDLIVSGDGRGAKLEAIISGYIYEIIILNPGLFPSDIIPSISILDDDNNQSAQILPIMQPLTTDYWNIKELSIIHEGSGYKKAPNLLIQGHIEGFEASGICLINGGISEINVINPGSGYRAIPKIDVRRKSLIIPRSSGLFLNHIQETPTPTQTVTSTPTFTPSQTVTRTVTPSSSCTNTLSCTPLSTRTPTLSQTPPITPSNGQLCGCLPQSGISLTATPTPTMTQSITPTPTATPSFTPSPTVTRTQTTTPTITRTVTPTPTLTKTSSPTPTQSPTLTVTPSQKIFTNSPDSDAILIARMNYSVSKIDILQGGRYTLDPSFSIEPSMIASGMAIITNPGSLCFGSKPSLKIIGSTISSPFRETRDPEAIPIINYSIAKVDILNSGYNYELPPTIRLIGGYDPINGYRGSLSATISSGSVTDISILNAGFLYKTAPFISILSNDSGFGLQIKITLSGSLHQVFITDPGLNLTSGTPNTTVFFENGGGPVDCEASITLDNTTYEPFIQSSANFKMNYRVTGASINNYGYGYNYSPKVTVSGTIENLSNNSLGRPAKAEARIAGAIRYFNIDASGSNYLKCRSNKNNKIYAQNGSNLIEISGLLTSMSSIFNYSGCSFKPQENIPCLYPTSGNIDQYVFNEKPNILFSDSTPIVMKTFAEIAGLAIGTTGIIDILEETRPIYHNTDKFNHIRSFMTTLYNQKESITNIFTPLSLSNTKDLNNVNNTHASILSSIDQYVVSVKGEIVGLCPYTISSIDPLSYGTYLGYAFNPYYVEHLISMMGFFDTAPELDIDDPEGYGADLTLNSLNNKMVRLWDARRSFGQMPIPPQSAYTIDSYPASGYSIYSNEIYCSSDLIISNATNYTSYATLVCKTPGQPTSWSNKPEFETQINQNGQVTGVNIINPGKGFYPQNAGNGNKFEIYFTGGGGSGAKATYSTDITNYTFKSNVNQLDDVYSLVGAITGVTITNSGQGYISPPKAVVIDNNSNWKDYNLHNRIFNPNYNPTLGNIGVSGVGGFSYIDFYFKNPKIYESRYTYIGSSSSFGDNRQASITSFEKNNIGLMSPGFYYRVNILGWLHSLHTVLGDVVKNRYIAYPLYKNGFVDDILFCDDYRKNMLQHPYDSPPSVAITNSAYLSNLIDALPLINTYIPSWSNISKFNWLVKNNSIS